MCACMYTARDCHSAMVVTLPFEELKEVGCMQSWLTGGLLWVGLDLSITIHCLCIWWDPASMYEW